tara:strand:- start:469 stop:615 length:147 start_codon:yes stop_codon:yes gene_type:complete
MAPLFLDKMSNIVESVFVITSLVVFLIIAWKLFGYLNYRDSYGPDEDE